MVKRWLPAVVLALTVIASGAQEPPASVPAPPPGAAQREAGARRETVRLYLVHRMREALSLSDAQTLKVLDVLEALDHEREAHQVAMKGLMVKIDALLGDPKTGDASFRDVVSEVQKEQVQFDAKARDLDANLLAVLTPRQQAQYLMLRRQLLEEIRQDVAPLRDRAARPQGRWRP